MPNTKAKTASCHALAAISHHNCISATPANTAANNDRKPMRSLLAAVFAGVALMQLWWLIAASAWQLAIFAFMFGICYGGFVALYPALTVDYFGGRHASGIIGVLYTGGAAGSFLGPKLAGDAFDRFGSYTIPIAIGAACALLAVVFVIAAPEPDRAPH